MPDPAMILRPQEISLGDARSRYFFQPSDSKPFVCTPAALEAYGLPCIQECLRRLQEAAQQHDGIDYLQIFEPVPADGRELLWFIEDDDGGAITALLPSDY